MKILILGSAGQIGSHLTNYFRKKKYQVIEFDKVNDLIQDLTIISNIQLESVIEESDFIFFLAFDVGGSHYLKKYQHTFQFIDNNTRLMANTFGLLQKYNKKFIFASSQMSNMNHSPYGILKNIGELYTKSINGLIVKFWNVYGIEKDREKSHVITDFIRKGFETGIIDMMTDGKEERDFLYVEDCCEALETIMENYNDFSSNDELHITSFKYTKIIDVANLILKLFHQKGFKNVKINTSYNKDSVQFNKKNLGNEYIKKWWNPKTNLEEGIFKIFNFIEKEYEFKK
jgi:nucleoside-diphosphate-sugar epimerase